MNIRAKRIGILGANRSGIGAAGLALRQGAIPFVSDISPAEKISESISRLQESGISYEAGGHSDKIFESDFVIISPGIPTDSTIVKRLQEKNIPVYAEIEFGSWFCKGRIVAITGTNGKTTTTSLMYHVVTVSGMKSYVAGNIGKAFSEIADSVESEAVVSLEVSSFQLDTISRFAPNVAIILNITPDHLNRYENNFLKYVHSKYAITRNQSEGDILILNGDDPVFSEYSVSTKASRSYFSTRPEVANGVYISEKSLEYRISGIASYTIEKSNIQLRGEHNYMNAAAVMIAAKYIGISDTAIDSGLRSFTSVEHRLEFAGNINGIDFINDSKATNVDSVLVALKSFASPLYLILGGQDKGNDYTILEPFMKNVKKIYAIGDSRKKIYDFFNGKIAVELKTDLAECITSVLAEGSKGDSLLLSPACASFDMFKDFEDRGKVFKAAVQMAGKHD